MTADPGDLTGPEPEPPPERRSVSVARKVAEIREESRQEAHAIAHQVAHHESAVTAAQTAAVVAQGMSLGKGLWERVAGTSILTLFGFVFLIMMGQFSGMLREAFRQSEDRWSQMQRRSDDDRLMFHHELDIMHQDSIRKWEAITSNTNIVKEAVREATEDRRKQGELMLKMTDNLDRISRKLNGGKPPDEPEPECLIVMPREVRP